MKTRCVCGSNEYGHLFGTKKFSIGKCRQCGLARTVMLNAPSKGVYSKDDFKVYKEKEQIFRSVFRRLIKFVRRYATSGPLLDIGAGSGILVDEAIKSGFDAIGVEPSKDMIRLSRKTFGINLVSSIPKNPKLYKIIVLNHVLEHLSNPATVIRESRNRLVPGGILVLGVPNFGCILAGIKKSSWQNLNPEQHKWHFTARTLDNLLVQNGFVRLAIISENHDRSMHRLHKRVVYGLIDLVSFLNKNGEAICVIYKKGLSA